MANFGGMSPTQTSMLGRALQPQAMLPQQPMGQQQFVPPVPAAPPAAQQSTVPLVQAQKATYTPGAFNAPTAGAAMPQGSPISPSVAQMLTGRAPLGMTLRVGDDVNQALHTYGNQYGPYLAGLAANGLLSMPDMRQPITAQQRAAMRGRPMQ